MASHAESQVVMDGTLLHHGDMFQCYLTCESLSLTRVSTDVKEQTIYLKLSDILGAHLDQRRSGGFVVEKCPSLDQFIHQRKETFNFIDELAFACVEDSEEKRTSSARDWVSAMSAALRGQSYERGEMVLPRRLKVIINPTAGSGDGVEFIRLLRPLLQRANIILDVTLTLMPGHARDIARVFSPILNEAAPPMPQIGYDALVIVGGDGTVHEVMNGLLGRRDWPRAVVVPLAIVPTGKNNLIAKSLGIDNLTYAAASLIKGKRVPFDVMAVIRDGQRMFLSTMFTWGAINDLPRKSTPLSSLFQLGIRAKQYPGKVYFRPVSDSSQVAPVVISSESASAAAAPLVSARKSSINQKDVAQDEDNSGGLTGTTDNYASIVNPEEDEQDEIMSKTGQYGPVTPVLTEEYLSSSSEWKVLTGNFAALVISNALSVVNGIVPSPLASPFDGVLDLFALKDASQMQLTKAMFALTTGSNPANIWPAVTACSVDAVVMVPATSNARTQPPQLNMMPSTFQNNSEFDENTMIAIHLLPHLFSILRS